MTLKGVLFGLLLAAPAALAAQGAPCRAFTTTRTVILNTDSVLMTWRARCRWLRDTVYRDTGRVRVDTVYAPAPVPGPVPVPVPVPTPVPLPAPSGRYPHEPAGTAVLADYDARFGSATAGTETATNPWFFVEGAGNLATIQDASAPVSPPNVGQVTFSPNTLAGTGPVHLASARAMVPPGTWSQYYLSYHWKYSSNFVAASTEIKHLDVWLGDDFYIAGTWGRNPPFPAHQRKFVALTGPAELSVNVWHQYEVLLTRTGSGVRAQLWVNGTLRRDDQLPYTNTTIVQLSWAFIYGGTGNNPPTTMQMFIDHIRASWR